MWYISLSIWGQSLILSQLGALPLFFMLVLLCHFFPSTSLDLVHRVVPSSLPVLSVVVLHQQSSIWETPVYQPSEFLCLKEKERKIFNLDVNQQLPSVIYHLTAPSFTWKVVLAWPSTWIKCNLCTCIYLFIWVELLIPW